MIYSSPIQPAKVCSPRFPVLTHRVSVEGLNGSADINSTTERVITVTLSSAHIPQLTVGQAYNVIITACSAFTCMRPLQPLVACKIHYTRNLLHVWYYSLYMHSVKFRQCSPYLSSAIKSTPLALCATVTTGTQSASVVFYGTSLSLNCTFAEGSTVAGCLFVFHPTNGDITENIAVNYIYPTL